MRRFVRPHGLTPGMASRQIAEREAEARIERVERRDHDLADFAGRHGIAGAGPDDLDNKVFVDDQPVARRALVGDEAEIGRGIGLIRRNAAGGDVVLQRFRKRGAGHERFFERRRPAAPRFVSVEKDLQEIGRAAIGDGPKGRDHRELLLGAARSRRNDGAVEGARRRVHDEAGRHEVVAERVEHDVAGSKAGGIQRACASPRIRLPTFRLEDRPRRREEAAERGQRRRDQAAERRCRLLQARQIGLAQNRQGGKRAAARDLLRIDAAEPLPVSRRLESGGDGGRQAGKEIGLASGRLARFKRVEMRRSRCVRSGRRTRRHHVSHRLRRL